MRIELLSENSACPLPNKILDGIHRQAVTFATDKQGSLAEKWGITEGKARRIKNVTDDSEKPVGQWNTMVIECLKDAVKVWVNGDLVNHGTGCTAASDRPCRPLLSFTGLPEDNGSQLG